MTDRYIKIKQTQPITQDYIKSLEKNEQRTADAACNHSFWAK
jgi:hypothetical protein